MKSAVALAALAFSALLSPAGAQLAGQFGILDVEANGGQVPENFVVTLPKVLIPEQVTAFVQLLDHIESELQLANGSIQIEVMVENTQALLSQDGLSHLPLIYKATAGRCRGAHFGTYDYTASFDITAAHQQMQHLQLEQHAHQAYLQSLQ